MNYSFLDLAYDVLKQTAKPLTYQEIWQAGQEKRLTTKVETAGKTPWQTLGARLYVEVRDNDASKFIPVGKRPTRFFLKERQAELPPDAAKRFEKEEGKKVEKKTEFHERDLHPLLTYFAYANPSFNRGRSIFTKTILHEKSTSILPREYFGPLEVLSGGRGAGTKIRFAMRAFGRMNVNTAEISEPAPGKELKEMLPSGIVTTFTVEPRGPNEATVTITTEYSKPGLRGWVERILAPAYLRRVYVAELAQLARVALARQCAV